MTADERWRRIEQLYQAALEQAPADRARFLESACGGDETLRRELERLLSANDQAEDFLAAPAWKIAPRGLAATIMTNDRDTSLAGRQIGHYTILSPLGRGGMGEVYRAHDSKLNREVALKVPPDLFALNPDRLARFKREAHVLASLNHPNIAAIYGFEDTGDVKALVLELVEGPTLADRLARGRLPLEDALPIARQIAQALEAAHERGIVHRDLKPANVKVRPDGVVKVLDFGLARALEVESSAEAATESPTVPSPVLTADGIIVGTPAYIAPEQVRGKPADKRSDLWAFGCVLYEILTGRRTFAGEDTSETLAAVMRDDPDWGALPQATPSAIRRLLRRCLVKDPKARAGDASIARIEIDDAIQESPIEVPGAQKSVHRRERVVWASVLAAVVAAAFAAVVWTRDPAPVARQVQFDVTTPPTNDPASIALSPDGQRLVFVAPSAGRNMLWMHTLESGAATLLPGTDGGTAPFWSPDSRSVAFFSTIDNGLKRIDVDGQSLQFLTTFPLGTGGAWNQDGTILFSGLGGPGPVFRISSTGGNVSPATWLEPTEQGHQFPQFLPDGRHFLYYAPTITPPAVYVRQLDGSEQRRLVDADSAAVYLSSGYVFFLRQGTLFAQAFDPQRRVLTGTPLRVADGVASSALTPAVSASATGTLAYRRGSALGLQRPLVWFDRVGRNLGSVGAADAGLRPSLSHDGRQVTLYRSVGISPPDIWRLTLDGGRPMRLTANGLINLDPIWSPDDRRIVYASNPKGVFDLYVTSVDGAATEQLLLESPQHKTPADWSPDGRIVLFDTVTNPPALDFDIWALALDADRKVFPVVASNANERQGQFSPDGRWLAYQSNETGGFEIYVQRFPGPGGKQRLSANGGAQPRWRRDGSELFYIALDGRLMSVPIQFRPDGLEPGPPQPLFATRVGGAVNGLERQQYVVSADGQRFLMSTAVEDHSPITVVLNWRP